MNQPHGTGSPLRTPATCSKERGSVTAETALLIPLLMMLLLLAIGVISAGQKALSLGEGTRVCARELARGTSPEQAQSLAAAQSPDSSFTIERDGTVVTVHGERALSAWLPVVLRAEAATPLEESPDGEAEESSSGESDE